MAKLPVSRVILVDPCEVNIGAAYEEHHDEKKGHKAGTQTHLENTRAVQLQLLHQEAAQESTATASRNGGKP